MQILVENTAFRSDYEKLRSITLNPARHTATSAHEHCEMVAARVAHLASLNGCTSNEALVLQNLAFVHDIGKISGSANPENSVELLVRYGDFDPGFVDLVKYHDINLPWYLSHAKGQPPSDKAWQKMASKVDLRLLCIFMVADRVDSPGGWRSDPPLVWFLQEALDRKLLKEELQLDDGPEVKQDPGASPGKVIG